MCPKIQTANQIWRLQRCELPMASRILRLTARRSQNFDLRSGSDAAGGCESIAVCSHCEGERHTINPANNWTLAKTLEDMDKAGTATAITSITTPGLWFGNAAVSRRLSRECNEYSAKIIRDYPGRFGLFAALPLPDIDGSLKKIEYALDVLKADGICMHTVYQDKATGIEDRFLGHPMFDPIHQELNRRKAIVYTQPKEADC